MYCNIIMIDANKLRKDKKKRDDLKFKAFENILSIINKKILIANHGNSSQVIYQVPQLLLGHPTYKLSECMEYIIEKINEKNFNTTIYQPNIIVISW